MSENIINTNLLKDSSKVVGCKQVLRGLSEGTIRCVIVAEDADASVKVKVVAAAIEKGIPVEYVPSKEMLGKDAGIKIGAATVGITAAEEI